MRRRDPFFDAVKVIAIFMVLFGHVHGLSNKALFPQWISNFHVGMNMPIFFMLSGYFAWRTIEAHDWKKLVAGVRSYFQPALFAGVLFTVVGVVMGLVCPSVRAIAVRLLRSVFVDPWFITTLAECYVLLFVSMVLGRRTKWGIFIAAALWLVVVCRPACVPGTIHWGCLVSMLPSYVFGAVVLKKMNFRLWENWKSGVSCLAAFLAFVFLEGDVSSNGMSFYTADSTVCAFLTLRGGGDVCSATSGGHCGLDRRDVARVGGIEVSSTTKMPCQDWDADAGHLHFPPLAARTIARHRLDWQQSVECLDYIHRHAGLFLGCYMAVNGKNRSIPEMDLGQVERALS